MKDWKEILSQSITTYAELEKAFPGQSPGLQEVIAHYPFRINPYFLNLIKKSGAPLFLQAIPDQKELQDNICIKDPLGEEALSPTPNLVHKYPDRVLMIICNECAMYCRFCTRKRRVGKEILPVTDETLERGFSYIRKHPEVREVLLSGGDPLLLDDTVLDGILGRLREIPTLEIIRIGTRTPSTLPMRITPALISVLRKYHPLYINTHFNHPDELTEEALTACTMLADAGIPLGNHTVLLRGVNDSADILQRLFLKLLRARVKPYYLFQADLTRGTDHFRTRTEEGIAIMRQLIGHISGMAIPTFALDAPGGKGKIPLTPDYVKHAGDTLIFENYKGEPCTYPEPLPHDR